MLRKSIFKFRIALLLNGKKDAAQNQIGKIVQRIFGFVLCRTITILMLKR